LERKKTNYEENKTKIRVTRNLIYLNNMGGEPTDKIIQTYELYKDKTDNMWKTKMKF
jgi:hypothetical protein